jgi:hypothetical protein
MVRWAAMGPSVDAARCHEPVGRTLARNVIIAVAVGAVFAFRRRDLGLLLPISALAIWVSLGGHYVEVLFLDILRPRIPKAPLHQRSVRLAVWFAGGSMLYVPMMMTARLVSIHTLHAASWWLWGLLFVGIELVVHAAMALRGSPNFYRGDG